MKITALELHNFLSHEDTRVEFDGARLVTLVGANGAGKSSILDAALFTLYDAARGKTDDLVRLGATDMSASIEFDFAGNAYRAVRGRTTRAGGKTFLELQVRDGEAWRPLTADSIRETQAAIEKLLHVDAATFTSAVFLRQGSIAQFVDATPAERKRVLGSILGLDRYAAAEAIARDRSLELSQEQRTQGIRAQQLDEALVRLPEAREAMGLRGADVASYERQIAETNAERAAAEKRLQELAGQLAAGEAAEADIARLESEIAELMDRYRRAQERQASAKRMAEYSATTLAGAAAVDVAIGAIPSLEERVQQLDAAENEALILDQRIQTARDAHRAASAAADREHAAWTATYEATRRQVDELAVAVQRLQPVVCEKCGHGTVVDQAGLREKLAAARRTFKDLEASQPKPSTSLARDAAAIARLEERRRELGDVRSPLAEARGELSRMEAQAARAEAMAQARQTARQAAEDEQAAIREQAEISTAGKVARASLRTAQAKVAELAGFRAERSAVLTTHEQLTRRLPELARSHSEAIADVGRLRASIEQLEDLQAERTGLAVAIETTSTELGRMKRLVAAFGVTGIPARIIESVLPELTGYAQELLGELRPGMELAIRAQRAKKDGKGVVEALDLVVQDTAGERPLAMFSGGERMSVSLALAVGLSRLVARRAGTALRTLVIDEPDGLDADARRAFGHALRVLAHHGELERVVLVSHHEDLADVGDVTYRVSKNGHGSVVEQV